MAGPVITSVVSGVPGRLASAVASGLADASGVDLVGVHNPNRTGTWNDVPYLAAEEMSAVDVVVECAPDHAVMANVGRWRDADVSVVVGTSGFTAGRIEELQDLWTGAARGCLVVPNFSIGAVLAARFAERAASSFETVEIVERHRSGKPDAPSGTALDTAARVAAAGGSSSPKGHEIVIGSLGGDVDGVRVHSLRLEGLLAHQEVALTNPGEQLSIVHQSTSYGSFAAGAVAAVRGVGALAGVHVGLDVVLEPDR